FFLAIFFLAAIGESPPSAGGEACLGSDPRHAHNVVPLAMRLVHEVCHVHAMRVIQRERARSRALFMRAHARERSLERTSTSKVRLSIDCQQSGSRLARVRDVHT